MTASAKIIITLTTVPNRLIEHNGVCPAQSALKTLLEQSYSSAYEVHFNIPISYDEILASFPEWINEYQIKYNHFKVFRTPDYGPITKLLPTLERIQDPETIIILADDDLYYMDGLIEAHIQAREKYPNCAIGFAGLSAIDGSCHFCTTLSKDTRVKILEGYKSVSYLSSFFDLNELKEDFIDKSWNDDLVLSAYMGYKNIHKVVLAYAGDTDYNPRVESFPVIGHVPTEAGGCRKFRNCEESQKKSEENIQTFYKIGYLER
jgi:hypothetical protein